jgi:hypothetical protein
MYGFRTHHRVAGHIRPLVTSNIATRRAAEPTNPLGEGEFDCELDRDLSGRAQSIAEIAERECVGAGHVRRMMRLGFLAPEIAKTIAAGQFDVPLVALLGAAAKQVDKLLAVLAEINPVPTETGSTPVRRDRRAGDRFGRRAAWPSNEMFAPIGESEPFTVLNNSLTCRLHRRVNSTGRVRRAFDNA